MSTDKAAIDDHTIFKVVINKEEQYSIWPADRENPLGWTEAGKTGPKAECLAYIEEVWTDKRRSVCDNRWKEARESKFGSIEGKGSICVVARSGSRG